MTKKPVFMIQDVKRRNKIRPRWRRPRGLHSKMRLQKKGHPKMPHAGYGSPKAERAEFRHGKLAIVSSVNAVSKYSGQTVLVSSSVGLKKRLMILEVARQNNVIISNLAADYDIKAKALIESRKKGRSLTKKKQTKKVEGKKDKKKTIEEKVDDEAQKKIEKEEKDKVLTKKGQ